MKLTKSSIIKSIMIFLILFALASSCSEAHKYETNVEEDGVITYRNNSIPKSSAEIKITAKSKFININPIYGYNNVTIIDSTIYFYDDLSKKIVKYNVDGDSLCSFGAFGQGPGEYPNMITLLFNSNDNIIAYDYQSGLFNLYDQNGNFVKNIVKESHFNRIKDLLFETDNYFFGKSEFYDVSKSAIHVKINVYDKDLNFIKTGYEEKRAFSKKSDPMEYMINIFFVHNEKIYKAYPSKSTFKIEVFDISFNKKAQIIKPYFKVKYPEVYIENLDSI
ncbi:MAG: hypothetical protein JXR48_04985 [Candidatus Delongbacteria bacterium]|nr:hypothetical protein [Candidatus Delongbacteria bacterium]MBN2834303.1 hypothetical protein [Candidatus Delongbacteria bacterium]